MAGPARRAACRGRQAPLPARPSRLSWCRTAPRPLALSMNPDYRLPRKYDCFREGDLDGEAAVGAGVGGDGGAVGGGDGADDGQAQALVTVVGRAVQALEGFEQRVDLLRRYDR